MKFALSTTTAFITTMMANNNIKVATAFDGYGPLPSEVAVGDEICVYGFAMDEWCIVDTGGTLLDMPSIVTLEQPEMHSFHCLLDVSVCVGSPYHILSPPGSNSDDASLYGTGWQLADNSKVVEVGRGLGDSSAGCTTCGDSGMQARGLRVSVTGTVVTTNPPVLEVTSVTGLQGDAAGCVGGGGETISVEMTEAPTVSPTAVVVVVATPAPTDMPTTLRPTPSPSLRPTAAAPTTTEPDETADDAPTAAPTVVSSSDTTTSDAPTTMETTTTTTNTTFTDSPTISSSGDDTTEATTDAPEATTGPSPAAPADAAYGGTVSSSLMMVGMGAAIVASMI